jgi:hypothetical protein
VAPALSGSGSLDSLSSPVKEREHPLPKERRRLTPAALPVVDRRFRHPQPVGYFPLQQAQVNPSSAQALTEGSGRTF